MANTDESRLFANTLQTIIADFNTNTGNDFRLYSESYSGEGDRKQDKEKAQRERTIQLSLYITDIDTNPIDGALVSYDKNSMTGFSTNEMGELVILCENYDTLYITKENYIGQIIPVNNRYEINVVLEKIPEDLLPAKDSTEKK